MLLVGCVTAFHKELPLLGGWRYEVDNECLPCFFSSVSFFIDFSFFMIAIPVLVSRDFYNIPRPQPRHSSIICFTQFFFFLSLSTLVFFKLQASLKLLVILSAVFSSSLHVASHVLHITPLQNKPLCLCILVFPGRNCIPSLCRILMHALQCKPHSAALGLLPQPLSLLQKLWYGFLSSESLCLCVSMSQIPVSYFV